MSGVRNVAEVQIPDIAEVREYLSVSRDVIPIFRLADLTHVGPCVSAYLEPFYEEETKNVMMEEIKALSKKGQSSGMVQMEVILQKICDRLSDRGFRDVAFVEGFWMAFLADCVATANGLAELRVALQQIIVVLRGREHSVGTVCEMILRQG